MQTNKILNNCLFYLSLILAELETRLKEDVDKIFILQNEIQNIDMNNRLMDKLQKQLNDTQIERDVLLTEKNNINELIKDKKYQKILLNNIENENEILLKNYENEKSSSAALLNSQQELLDKIKILQNDNDELIIEMEGKRNIIKMLQERNLILEETIDNLKKFKREFEIHGKVLNDDKKFNSNVEPTPSIRLIKETTNVWSNKSR